MKTIFLSSDQTFEEVPLARAGSWINLVAPSAEELQEVADQFQIDLDDLRAPLDIEESARLTIEDHYRLIIVDVPVQEERNGKTYYMTIPLGIILTDSVMITTSSQELELLTPFTKQAVKQFFTYMRTRFVFQILYRNTQLYLTALRSIDRQTDRISTHIERATRNEQVIDMMELEKSLVYLKASLKMNDRIIRKLTTSTSLKKYPTDEELLEDTLVESQQALEMADIYGTVLSAMTETSAAIIANNQNDIMKTLALITIALDIPAMIFSAYGINVGESGMPFAGHYHAFWMVVLVSATISLLTVLYFIRNKWF